MDTQKLQKRINIIALSVINNSSTCLFWWCCTFSKMFPGSNVKLPTKVKVALAFILKKNLLTSFPVSNVNSNSKPVFSNWSSNSMKSGLAQSLFCQHLSGLSGTISAASCAVCTPYKRISLPLLLHNKRHAGTAKWSAATEWHFCTKILGAIIKSFRGEKHGNSLHRLHSLESLTVSH